MKNITSPLPPKSASGRWQWRFLGFAAGVFITLLIAPTTGWIARQQALASLAPWTAAAMPLLTDPAQEIGSDPETAALLRGAQRLPNDSAVQAAYAIRRADDADPNKANNEMIRPLDEYGNALERFGNQGESKAYIPYTDHLKAVLLQFPADPLPYALYLRYSLDTLVQIARPELKRIETPSSKKDTALTTTDWSNSPTAFSDYNRIGTVGERLDPNNAYFPMMRAIGHLASHEDSEALQDLDRASQKPYWNDYSLQELHGKWRLTESAFGRQSAQVTILDVDQYPVSHYRQLRLAAALILLQAVMQENHRNISAGLGLRERLMHVGEMICVQDPNRIGKVTGNSIFQLACSYAGSQPLSSISSASDPNYDTRIQSYFSNYLSAHGYAQEQSYFQSQYLNCQHAFDTGALPGSAARYVAESGSVYDQEQPSYTAWFLGLMFPGEILLLSLFALASALYAYQNRFATLPLRRLPQSTLWGAAIGLGMTLVGGIAALALAQNEFAESLVICIPALMLVTLASLGYYLRAARPLLFTAVITSLGLFSLLALLYGLTCAMHLDLNRYYFSRVRASTSADVTLTLVALLMALPTALFWLSAVAAKVRHQPLIAGGLHTFRNMVLPVIALLLLSYSGLLIVTGSQEVALSARLAARYGGPISPRP